MWCFLGRRWTLTFLPRWKKKLKPVIFVSWWEHLLLFTQQPCLALVLHPEVFQWRSLIYIQHRNQNISCTISRVHVELHCLKLWHNMSQRFFKKKKNTRLTFSTLVRFKKQNKIYKPVQPRDFLAILQISSNQCSC